MRFRCERDALLESLTAASRAASTRSGLSASFGGVRIETRGDRAHLAGTDMELSIQTVVPIQSSSEGVAVIPGKLAVDIVRAFDEGVVNIETGDDNAVFSCGRSEFTVRLFAIDDFPALPHRDGGSVTIAARSLGDALGQVVRAASTDESKPLLTGVLLAEQAGGLRVVATDSYRLAVRDLPGTNVLSEGNKVLVPARALGELQRILATVSDGQDLTFWLGSTEVTFEIGTVVLTARLLSGDFPEYQRLIPPSYPNQMIVAKTAILDAMRRMKLLIKDNTTPVRISLREEGAVLNVISPDVGHAREDVDAKYSGTEMNVAFNPNYLIDGIEAIPTDDIILETIDSTKPATIRASQDGDFQYLLMPVRVS